MDEIKRFEVCWFDELQEARRESVMVTIALNHRVEVVGVLVLGDLVNVTENECFRGGGENSTVPFCYSDEVALNEAARWVGSSHKIES